MGKGSRRSRKVAAKRRNEKGSTGIIENWQTLLRIAGAIDKVGDGQQKHVTSANSRRYGEED